MGEPIFTVGHSTHEMQALLALLGGQGVLGLADVRRHPGSRRLPWFNRDPLARDAERHGLDYQHIPQLGGRRPPHPGSANTGWEVEAFRGYADHMASEEFGDGLRRLEALARERPTAAMCSEGPWWRCHRRLLADALTVRGWEVRHIAPDGRVAGHELTAFAVAEGGRLSYPPLQPTLEAG